MQSFFLILSFVFVFACLSFIAATLIKKNLWLLIVCKLSTNRRALRLFSLLHALMLVCCNWVFFYYSPTWGVHLVGLICFSFLFEKVSVIVFNWIKKTPVLFFVFLLIFVLALYILTKKTEFLQILIIVEFTRYASLLWPNEKLMQSHEFFNQVDLLIKDAGEEEDFNVFKNKKEEIDRLLDDEERRIKEELLKAWMEK